MFSATSLTQITKPFILLLYLLLSTTGLQAHEIRPAIIDLEFLEGGQYDVTVQLNLEALIANVSRHQDSDDSDNATEYDSLRQLPPNELAQAFSHFEPTFFQGLHISVDGVMQSMVVRALTIPATGDISLARDSRLVLTGTLPNNANDLIWSWQSSFGASALRVSTPTQRDIYTAYLREGQSSSTINLKGLSPPSSAEIISNYLAIGFTHILPKGLDHILFVIGLFLLSASLRSLVFQISSFTVAHTLTLALGMLGLVQVSSAIVEPLIAASIIYVCVENIFTDRLQRWRPVIVFLFGLLHGLGFASVLREIGLSSGHFATGLIAFNIGVELGQLTVIAACFMLVGLWFKDKPWYRQRITIPASGIIALIGGYWLVERTLLI